MKRVLAFFPLFALCTQHIVISHDVLPAQAIQALSKDHFCDAELELEIAIEKMLKKTRVVYNVDGNGLQEVSADKILKPMLRIVDQKLYGGSPAICVYHPSDQFNYNQDTSCQVILTKESVSKQSLACTKYFVAHELGHKLLTLLPPGHECNKIAAYCNAKTYETNRVKDVIYLASTVSLCTHIKRALFSCNKTHIPVSAKLIGYLATLYAGWSLTFLLSSKPLQVARAQHAMELFCDTYAAVVAPSTIPAAIKYHENFNPFIESILSYVPSAQKAQSHPFNGVRIKNFKKIQTYLANNPAPEDVLNWSRDWVRDHHPELRESLTKRNT